MNSMRFTCSFGIILTIKQPKESKRNDVPNPKSYNICRTRSFPINTEQKSRGALLVNSFFGFLKNKKGLRDQKKFGSGPSNVLKFDNAVQLEVEPYLNTSNERILFLQLLFSKPMA